MTTRVIVDSNSICHQLKHTIGDLSQEEKYTGVVFGFLRQILTLSRALQTTNFVFAWDSVESKRRQDFPDYKRNRRKEKTREEKELDAITFPQFDELREEILPRIGFRNIFQQSGYEGDDLIASVTWWNPGEFIIVSSDEDLYQLLENGRIIMYSVRKKTVFTEDDLIDKYGVLASEWPMVKAIAGCSTDCIPGVPGIAEKTASKYITEKLGKNSKALVAIENGHELIKRNLPLVTLPYEGTKKCRLVHDKLSFDAFVEVCEEKWFNSFLYKETLTKWKVFFGES